MNKSIKKGLVTGALLCCATVVWAAEPFVDFNGNGLLLNSKKRISIFVGKKAQRGVERAAKDLCADIGRVTGTDGVIVDDARQADIEVCTKPNGKWEEYQIKNEKRNGGAHITITGSDRRGTIYGIYELSSQMGVSPWYWWADVAVAHHDRIFIKPGIFTDGEPRVKYRGIFINDESPSFTGWANKKFGGLNSKMYAHMFELILRLKANYLWPAMWGNAFNEDDSQNPVLADEYGVVMGTSHHEPMMRAYNEYRRRRQSVGAWNYATNKDNVNKFFREGMENAKSFDNIVTIGMRGDGDEAMAGGSDDDNINTLKDVIANQRQIIESVTGRKAKDVAQLWAIFTEVQRYYDRGLSVPDDVIKVFCDNNWGYIRRTGPDKERNADGSFKPMGLYYHIDMNGGPWNDRWINTTTIPKLQNQLSLAYRTGLDDLWIINVGDLKPKEIPIDFIMRLAWNPDRYGIRDSHRYMVDFCAQSFGKEHAEGIAQLIETYSNLNLQRKPESQSTAVYSANNYHEADRMIARWEELAQRADSLLKLIPQNQRSAFFQLAYYPAVASAQTALVYLYATKSQNYFLQGNVSLNHRYAQLEKAAYARDKQLQAFYNDTLAGGKWKNMMQDIHIGYKQWFMPEKDSIPECKLLVADEKPSLGVAVEGYEKGAELKLPKFDVLDNQSYYIDVFNRGKGSLKYKVKTKDKWIVIDKPSGTVADAAQLHVSIDWNKIAEGEHTGTITISSNGTSYDVAVTAVKKPLPECSSFFFGSMSAQEFSFPALDYNEAKRAECLPGLGRDKGCVSLSAKDGSLSYNVYFPKAGKQTILVGILPTQDINPKRGLHFSLALDNQSPRVIDARKGLVDTFGEYTPQALSKNPLMKPVAGANRAIKMIVGNGYCRNEVHDNIRWIDVEVDVASAGIYSLKITNADAEIMFERFVVNPDNHRYSYLGAPTIKHGK